MNKPRYPGLVIHQLQEDIFCLQETYLRDPTNLFLIIGEQSSLLIDAGIGIVNFPDFFATYGIDSNLFLSHAHFDHAGDIGFFKSSDIIIAKETLANLHNRSLWGLQYLCPKEFDREETLRFSGKDPVNFCQDFRIDTPQQLKSCSLSFIDLGNFYFEIISTPGHTDDSMVLYEREKKMLISGDFLYAGRIYKDFPNSCQEDFIKTLLFLQQLDINYVLAGYNQALIDKSQMHGVISEWLEVLE